MEKSYRWKRFGEDKRITRFKWEFLRRNPEYQRDFEEFASEFPAWTEHLGLVPRPSVDKPEALSYFQEVVEPAAWKITRKWCVREPIHPALPFEIGAISFYRPEQLEEGYEGRRPVEYAKKLAAEHPESVRDYFSHHLGDAPHTPEGLRYIQVQLDITQPLEVLFQHLEIHVEVARARYRVHVGPFPEYRKRPRARLQDYESYLKVWDLRTEGLTFEKIASRLFPKEMKNVGNRATTVKRIRWQFKRAQQLIEGEYRRIEG